MTSNNATEPSSNDSKKSILSSLREAIPTTMQHTLRRAGELRHQHQGRQRSAPLPTSIDALDELLGGGLSRGLLLEIVGRSSCGRFAAQLAALRAVTGAGEIAALIDQGHQLDPQHAAHSGIELQNLLWLQPENTPDSLAAAEMLIRTGFGLIALDFGLPPVRGRATLAAWLRLARCCAEYEAIALVGAPYRLSGCAADAVVTAHRGRGRWSGATTAPRLLEGLSAELDLNRRRGHRTQTRTAFNLIIAEADFGHRDTAPIEYEEDLHARAT